MLDLYHAQIGEGNLIELCRRALPWIGEIQAADFPGRCEPGTGEIAYPAIATALKNMGYTGTSPWRDWRAMTRNRPSAVSETSSPSDSGTTRQSPSNWVYPISSGARPRRVYTHSRCAFMRPGTCKEGHSSPQTAR